MTKWFIALVLVAGCTYDYQYYNAADAAPLVDGESPHGVTMRGWALHKEMTMGDNQLAGNVVNANFPATEDGAAAEYTVQVGISQTPNAIAANGPPNLRAIISWNTNGQQIERMVSVGGGTSISGSAEGVSVSLQDFSGEPAHTRYEEYDVTVTVVPGVRASTSAPPTLIPLPSEATLSGTNPGGSIGNFGNYILAQLNVVAVEVPQNAGVQSVLIVPGTDETTNKVPDDIVVREFDSTGTPIKSYQASTTLEFVPLSPGCTHVHIENYGANTVQGVSLTWGVDG
jgi:hypothetical protein